MLSIYLFIYCSFIYVFIYSLLHEVFVSSWLRLGVRQLRGLISSGCYFIRTFWIWSYSFSNKHILRYPKSYLDVRTQRVEIGSSTSEPVTLKYGFYEEQSLDLFCLPRSPLPIGNIIGNHGMGLQVYTGDTKMHISFKSSDLVSRHTAISQVRPVSRTSTHK